MHGHIGVYKGMRAWESRGVQGVYTGVKGYIRVFGGIQEYTEVYRSIHGYTWVYKGVQENAKLNARLALRQRADLLVVNISSNRVSLPQGQSYTLTTNKSALCRSASLAFSFVFSGCTRVYKGIQGCTRVYKCIQGYTGVFKGVQG